MYCAPVKVEVKENVERQRIGYACLLFHGCGYVKCCLSMWVCNCRVGPCPQEHSHQLLVTSKGSQDEGGLTVCIALVYQSTVLY